MRKAYEARREMDQTEGRGGSTLLGYFWTKPAAESAAEGHGVQGCTGPVHEIFVVKSEDGNFYKLADAHPIIISEDVAAYHRATAIAKLTPAERKALGV